MLSISPHWVVSPWVVLLAIAASLLLVHRKLRNDRLPYPPGPKGYPVIGNVFDIPQHVPLWKAAVPMGETYSERFAHTAHVYKLTPGSPDTDVLYLNVLGADQIVLNSNEAISDLLDKRSAIYSDRVRAT